MQRGAVNICPAPVTPALAVQIQRDEDATRERPARSPTPRIRGESGADEVTGIPTTYSYGANGLRTQRVDATGTSRYLLDGPSVLEELDGVNAGAIRYFNN